MLYHHAITSAVARDRTEALIAQAAADGPAGKPDTARTSRLFRWSRRLAGRVTRHVAPSMKSPLFKLRKRRLKRATT